MIYNQMLHRFVIYGLDHIPNFFKPEDATLECVGKAGTIGFTDIEQEQRFEDLLVKTGISALDCERLPMLYVFSCKLFFETGINLEDIFDFKSKGLLTDKVREMLKSVPETQRKMCLATIHLYNDSYPDVDTLELFENLDWNATATMLNAIKIRFI